MKTKRTAILALTLAIALSPLAATPPASAEGTSAVVVNQRDDSEVYRLMLQIRRAVGDVVDTTNVAAAVASCDTCQTVAVALQGVLVTSDPSIFVPENLALAMNIDCNECQTLASAYQTLVQTGGPAHFTPEGNHEIAAIRQELESLRNSGLSIFEVQDQVDALNTRLQQVLWTQVVPAGPPESSTPTSESSTPTQTTPSDTETTTSPSESDTGTTTSGSDTGTPESDSGTTTTGSDTGTTTTPSDTGTTTTDTGTTTTDTTTTDTTDTTTTDSTSSP